MAIAAGGTALTKSRRSSLNTRFDRVLNEHAPMYDRHLKAQKRARVEEEEVQEPPPPPPAAVQARFHNAHTRTGLAARRGVGGVVAGTSVKMNKPVPTWLAQVLDIPLPPPPAPPPSSQPFSTPNPGGSIYHSSPSSIMPSSPLAHAHPRQIPQLRSAAYGHLPASDPQPFRLPPPPATLQIAYSTPSYQPPTWHSLLANPPSLIQTQTQPHVYPPQHYAASGTARYPYSAGAPLQGLPHFQYDSSPAANCIDGATQQGTPLQPFAPVYATPVPVYDYHALPGHPAPSYRSETHTMHHPPTYSQASVYSQTAGHAPSLQASSDSSPPPFARYLADRGAPQPSPVKSPLRPLCSSSPTSRFTINTDFGDIPLSLSRAQAALYSDLPPEKRRKLERKQAERLAGLQMVRDLEESVEAMSMEESMSIDQPTSAQEQANLPGRVFKTGSRRWDDGSETDELALESGDELEEDEVMTTAKQRLLPVNAAPSPNLFRVDPVWSSSPCQDASHQPSSPLGTPTFSIGSPDDASTPLKTPHRLQAGDKRKHMRSKGTQTPTKDPVDVAPEPTRVAHIQKRRKLSSRAAHDVAEYVPTHRPSSDSGFTTPSASSDASPSPPPPRMRQMKITEGAWKPFALPIGDPATSRMLPIPTTWEERQAMARVNGHSVVNHEEDELVSSGSEVEDIENWSETDLDFSDEEDERPVGGRRVMRRLSTVLEESEEEDLEDKAKGDEDARVDVLPESQSPVAKNEKDAELGEGDGDIDGIVEEIEEFTPSQDVPIDNAEPDVPTVENIQEQVATTVQDPKALLPVGWEASMPAALIPTTFEDRSPGKRVRFRSRSSSVESDTGSITEVDEHVTPPADTPSPALKKKKRIKYSPNPPSAIPKKGCFKRGYNVSHDVGFAIYRDGY